MVNYSKVKCTGFFAAILVLLLSVAAMVVLPGCGSSEKDKISGRITLGGAALSGVTVTLSGDTSRSTETDANGNYSFNDVPSGTFTLTPSLTGYTFSPTKRKVFLQGQDAIGFNFSGTGQGRVVTTTHTVYLTNNGTVLAWGSNSNGQLGDGSTTQSAAPVKVPGLSGITAIAAGSAHTVALKDDGTVWAWGNNSNGQLGDGSTNQSATPVKVTVLSGVVTAIAAGSDHTVALKDDGTVWAWGLNSNGQLGNGNTTQKTTPVQVTGLSSAMAITAGSAHTVALKDDGTVWAWGLNSNGQLGNGNTAQKTTPVQVKSLSSVIAIAAGVDHTVALKDDGTVWDWGNNSNGQLGNGNTTQETTPVQVAGLSGMIAVAAGHADTVALKNDGTVWAWGNNSNGQLGDGTTTDRQIPVQAPLL